MQRIVSAATAIFRLATTLLFWGLIAIGAYLLFPIVSNYVSNLEFSTGVVAVNAIATITSGSRPVVAP